MDAITVANTIGSGALNTGSDLANGPAGSMLYVGLGATFLVSIASLILVFIHMIRG